MSCSLLAILISAIVCRISPTFGSVSDLLSQMSQEFRSNRFRNERISEEDNEEYKRGELDTSQKEERALIQNEEPSERAEQRFRRPNSLYQMVRDLTEEAEYRKEWIIELHEVLHSINAQFEEDMSSKPRHELKKQKAEFGELREGWDRKMHDELDKLSKSENRLNDSISELLATAKDLLKMSTCSHEGTPVFDDFRWRC